jgi:hypothetical protein
VSDIDEAITLRYLGVEYKDFIVCRWAIELPKSICGKEIADMKKWTDEAVGLKRNARVGLKRTNSEEYPPKYELIISGRGEDERCTWCRSFRTSLETNMKQLNCPINQHGSCDFE